MSIDSSADWDGLRAVSSVVNQTLTLLTRSIEAGITTRDLDAVAARFLESCGARSAPALVYGFPGAVLISVNEEVVHGVPGGRVIAPGDLVSLDVTVELDAYVADAARSLVVGSGPAVAHRLVSCAAEAFEAGAAVATAGVPVSEIGRAVESTVRRHGFSVLKGLAGHGVGRAIHEPPIVPNHCDRRQRDVLADGLVITIEPMIAAGTGHPVQEADGWTIRTRDRSLAAHYEDTVVITRGTPVNLTAAAA